MDILILLSVLFAAFLHAFWNFLLKGHDDKPLSMYAITLGHAVLAVLGFGFFGVPSFDIWGYVLAGGVLHSGYQIFLMNAYRFGALSNIYPLARGLSPLILAVVSLVLAQDVLSFAELAGIGLVAGALIILGLVQYRFSRDGTQGLVLALVTGFFIAGYSLVDALGTRLVGSAFVYFGATTLVNFVIFHVYCLFFHKSVFSRVGTHGLRMLVVGGVSSYLAYIIVLWACLSMPVAVVSSLRETSVLFAMILGVVVLKERLTVWKVLACCAVSFGVVLMRLG